MEDRQKLTSKALASWNRGFGSRQEHGHLSVVNVVCWCVVQVKASVTGRSHVQSSPTAAVCHSV
jgi:hypothetical protein